MAEITAAAVKALRERTDLPMMECKKALVEAGGDEEKAIAILKEQFKKIQTKRADNATEEGRVFIKISDDGKTAAMVEIQCESPPVATGESMAEIGEAMVAVELAEGCETPDELMAQTDPASGRTFKDLYEEMVNKIREKIVVNRVTRVDGPVGGYVHHDYKTGVLFQAKGDKSDADVLRDVAMHIAALQPSVTFESELNDADVKAERDRLSEEARSTGKPENIIEKIVDGRMKNYYIEQGVLVSQPFAKDDSKSVRQALAEAGFEAVGFHRWTVGSGT